LLVERDTWHGAQRHSEPIAGVLTTSQREERDQGMSDREAFYRSQYGIL